MSSLARPPGVLVGLQFVVLTLVAERGRRCGPDAAAAFATPNIVHFCAVLFLSALLCIPWHAMPPVALCWGLAGLGGMAYVAIVAWRMRSQTSYQPELEDWCLHAVLPFVAYLTLAGSALIGGTHTRRALFAVGAAALSLLFAGIHNAWDAVVYHILVSQANREADKNP